MPKSSRSTRRSRRPLTSYSWTVLIREPAFQDFARRVGMTDAATAHRLQDWVQQGLLVKSPYRPDGGRTRLEYRLTPKGLDLLPALLALMQWGDRWLDAAATVESPWRLDRSQFLDYKEGSWPADGARNPSPHVGTGLPVISGEWVPGLVSDGRPTPALDSASAAIACARRSVTRWPFLSLTISTSRSTSGPARYLLLVNCSGARGGA